MARNFKGMLKAKPREKRTPIDRVAARVLGRGKHKRSGKTVRRDQEVCVRCGKICSSLKTLRAHIDLKHPITSAYFAKNYRKFH